MYALILAGGIGSRLWPKSRKATPKQFLNLAGSETMIQTTVRRILPIIKPDHIFVVTGTAYVDMVQEQLPMLPADNIIAEPSGKNTAPAIGLGGLYIKQLDPTSTMAVLTADHLIPNEEAFRQALLAADAVAQEGKLVTLGVTATGPETGYGYVHRGEALGSYQAQTVYRVKQFLEKPDLETAQTFYDSGDYYWNSGMFIWQTDTLFRELAQHAPQLNQNLQALESALFENEPETEGAKVAQIWDSIEPDSIDFGLMEKASNVAVVPLDAGWNDVGSWSALYDELAEREDENISLNAEHLAVDSEGILIQGNGKLIATVGVDNIVIIETDDAILVCHKDKTQDVKQIVNKLKADSRTEYL